MSNSTFSMKVRVFICLIAVLSFGLADPPSLPGRSDGSTVSAATRLQPLLQKGEYSYAAAAPVFFLDDGYQATLFLHNNTDVVLDAELSVSTNAAATPLEPLVLSIPAGQAVTVNVADLLTLTDPDNSHPVVGDVLARYNAKSEEGLTGRLVLTRFGEKQAFSVPLLRPEAIGDAPHVRYAPLVDFTAGNHSIIAMQNLSDEPAEVEMKLHVQTGDPGTPTVDIPVSAVIVAPWKSFVTNLAPLAAACPTASWGSIEVSSMSPSLVYHAVTMYPSNEFAYDSEFVDPLAGVSTTKVLTPLVLDYDAESVTHILVRNLSTSARTVTAVFTTPDDSSTQVFSVSPGVQRLFSIAAQDYLSQGERVTGDARLSYSGLPSDIVVSAVNLSTAKKIAVCARTIESSASQSRRLLSPYFSLEGTDFAIVQLTNLSAANVLVGAKLQIADIADPKGEESRTSALATVPAFGTAILNLVDVLNDTPEGFAARGALEVLHNGQPGAIAATFFTSRAISDVQVATLRPVPSIPSCYRLLSFPSNVTLLPAGSVQIAMLSDGTVATPGIRTESGGTATAATWLAPNVYTTTYTAPTHYTSSARMVSYDQVTQETYGCGGTTVEFVDLELQSLPPTRLNPEATTPFTLTAKGQRVFPAGVALTVVFRRNGQSVNSDPINLTTPSTTLSGDAPANTVFIGEVTSVRVVDAQGNKVTKVKQNPGFYYAFNPPSVEMSAEPAALNREGGYVEIVGSGFKSFGENVLPTVSIGEISYHVRDVSVDGTRIYGSVGRALYNVATCPTSNPCRRIRVTNPGGISADRVETVAPAFTLNVGPFPVSNGYLAGQPTEASTAGAVETVIVGTDLWNLRAVTFGNHSVPYNLLGITDEQIRVTVPSSCQTGNQQVRLADIDNAAPNQLVPGGFTFYPTNITPVSGDLNGLPMYVLYGLVSAPYIGVYRAGPADCNVQVTADPAAGNIGNNGCGSYTVSIDQTSNTTWRVTVQLYATGCPVGPDYTRPLAFTLRTTEQGAASKTITMVYTISGP